MKEKKMLKRNRKINNIKSTKQKNDQNISDTMFLYTWHRENLIGVLSGEGIGIPFIINGKILNHAKIFCNRPIPNIPTFSIVFSMKTICDIVDSLCKLQSELSYYVTRTNTYNNPERVNANDVLRISSQYFPSMGLEDYISGVKLLVDEYNRQKPLMLKFYELIKKHEYESRFVMDMKRQEFYKNNQKEIDSFCDDTNIILDLN